MDAGVALPAILTILAVLILVSRRKEGVRRTIKLVEYCRGVIGFILLVLIAVTFLRSGSTLLFTIALLLIAFSTAWFAIERPDKNLV